MKKKSFMQPNISNYYNVILLYIVSIKICSQISKWILVHNMPTMHII
jgi:hypothetical protein